MPDRLTDAIVDIATQLRRLADAHTTPTDDEETTTVDRVRQMADTWEQPLPSINANDVQGFCPACGHGVLMLGDGGHVTCTLIDCPNPAAADELLRGDDGCLKAEARVRNAVHIADADDVTDWQRGFRACATVVLSALDDTAPTDDDQPVQQPTAGTREFAERERARMERLYTRETVRAEKAEAAAAVYREDAEHNATRAERAEQRAASMERAMESTAADALKHGGCHRKLMAQCTRAETAEQRRDELAATLFEVLGHFTRKGHPGTPCLESGWVREDTVKRWRAVLWPSATDEPQPDAR